ncbi:MAG: hypothetical protein ACRD7F_06220 [Nitrososphaeraceae archaeon]
MLPVMPDVMLPVMLPVIPVVLLAIPVMLLSFPVMFSANTTVPIAGTSNIPKAKVIAIDDKIKPIAILI